MKRWSILAAIVLAACSGGGCSAPSPELETEYGSRQPLRGGNSSVNGTGVLAEMYEAQGNSVLSVRKLSPRVMEADTIVWFMDDGEPPSQAAVNWFDSWLYGQPGRTLVIVPRDFDAAELYWRKVQSQASPTELPLVQTRQTEAATRFQSDRLLLPPGVSDWEWFQYDSRYKPRKVTTLSGEITWTKGVNPANLEIELYGRVVPDYVEDDVLLASSGDPIVTARDVNLGRVIVVANGSFLLNLPLVNKEHRKLAGALINESTSGNGDQVVFLESGGTVAVSDSDKAEGMPSAWRYVNTPPLSYLLRSVIFFSLIMIFAMWPIFGVAREEPRRHLMDFGRHIEALGKLLARTRNARYAWSRISLYRQLTGEGTRGTSEQAPPQDPLSPHDQAASQPLPLPQGLQSASGASAADMPPPPEQAAGSPQSPGQAPGQAPGRDV